MSAWDHFILIIEGYGLGWGVWILILVLIGFISVLYKAR